MDHLSDWHGFDARDTSTYPKVNAPVQIRYADGGLAVGYTLDFFPRSYVAEISKYRRAIHQGLLRQIARRPGLGFSTPGGGIAGRYSRS